jgi:thioredoxin-dependent peroxiredoxin
MTRSLVALLLTFAATTAAAALEEGAAAPDFTAPAALAGKAFTYSLAEARAKGPVVVYFYPSAYTGGCNIQARAFADHKADFDAAGASVVGVSLDSIARLEDFSADPEYCGGKVAVASDADGSIAKRYGLKVVEAKLGIADTRGQEIDHGFTERTTFVVSPDGKVAATIGGMAPAANVDKALATVQAMAAARAAAKPVGD